MPEPPMNSAHTLAALATTSEPPGPTLAGTPLRLPGKVMERLHVRPPSAVR